MLHGGKCSWTLEKVKFFGHIINGKGLECEPAKIETVKNFPRPHNVKTTRSFIGLASYYRKFIKNFAGLASPLHDLLKKDQKFVWGPNQESAFLALKEALTTPPVLRHPDFSKTFILSTDASTRSLSYILQQRDEEGKLQPCMYGARSLHGSELSYCISEIECLAILSGVRAYANYLSNRHFIIQADNISLTYLKSLKNAHGRLLRWSLYFQTFDYSIEHVAGTKNVPSDDQSRLDYPDGQESEDVEKFFQDSILSITSQDACQLGTILQKTSIKYEFVDDTCSEKTNSPQDMITTIEVTPANEHQQSETTSKCKHSRRRSFDE